jgi:hypothetical protein
LVYEVVDNSIDEALAGYCDTITVAIKEGNGISIKDNGSGIPVDFHEKEQKSALEVVMTKIGAGGKLIKILTKFLVVFTELGFLVLTHFLTMITTVSEMVMFITSLCKRKSSNWCKKLDTLLEEQSFLSAR